MEKEEELLKPEQVAEILNVSMTSVYRWLNTGELKGIRVGKLWRVRKSDLQKIIQQGKEEEQQ